MVFAHHIQLWELDREKGRAPRIDAFSLWCWGRLLRIPLIARRSTSSVLKEITPEYSLKGLMPKLQCFGYLMQRFRHDLATDKNKNMNPLGSKEIKPVNPKGNQQWLFIGRTDAQAKAPILWPSDVKSQLVGKDPDAGKYWGQEEKRVTENEIVGWHHQLNGHESEQTPGDGEGQGSPVCSIL